MAPNMGKNSTKVYNYGNSKTQIMGVSTISSKNMKILNNKK
jgi:hypothetical protein